MRTRSRRAAVLLGSVPLLTLAVTSPARAGAYEDEVFACLDRTPPALRPGLPGTRHRDRHSPRPAPGRLVPLPLGHPTTIPTNPLTY